MCLVMFLRGNVSKDRLLFSLWNKALLIINKLQITVLDFPFESKLLLPVYWQNTSFTFTISNCPFHMQITHQCIILQ